MKPALEKIIDIVGSQTALAKELKLRHPASKIGQGHVQNWLNRDEKIPSEWVIDSCAAVDFQVTPHELRPDIYPHPHDGLPEVLRTGTSN